MIELNKIYNEDCILTMKRMEDKSVDLVLTDPPYGITACKWDKVPDLEVLWKEFKRIGKDNCAYVLTASQPFTSALVMSNIKMFKYEWIWNKRKAGNFAIGNKQPLKIHENILVFYKNQPIYNPQKIQLLKENKRYLGKKSQNIDNAIGIKGAIKYAENYEPDKLLPVSIQEFKKDNYKNNVLHPTQKPVALFEYLIKTYTNEGDLVYDGFMGSGTTAVACIDLKRNWIGSEISPEYCKIANERIKNLHPKLL